ncbi:MAG TPA: HD domain-containing protein [Deltaproteobacteria bacterium]|nr:HD domain-containing protein [Deltaproteobacteria bacterium]
MIFKEIPHPTIRMDQKCSRDLYVRIKDDYRLFAARGAVFTHDHARLFSTNNIRLYIQAEDLEAAEAYLNTYLHEILVDPAVNPKVKSDIIYTTSMKSIRQIYQGMNMRNIAELESSSESTVKLILSDKRVMNNLIEITSHDHFTYKHSVKVGIFGTALAINLFQDKLHEHDIAKLSTAFFLHDIGMSKVPAKILDKKGPLTREEWDIVRKHPIWGHEKLMKAQYSSDEAAAIVLYHHERCDRKGYPFKRLKSSIPLYSRICAIADTFEALISTRPFRNPKTPFEAIKIMQQEMAREFDPQLFKAFIMLLGPGK